MDEESSVVTTILDLSTLLYDAKHVLARKALVHQTDEVLVNVYILEPGGASPRGRGNQAAGYPRALHQGAIPAAVRTAQTVRLMDEVLQLDPPSGSGGIFFGSPKRTKPSLHRRRRT